MPRFDHYKRRLHGTVDGMFAERVRIVSWKDGREDPDRPAREIIAPLVDEERDNQNLSGGRAGKFLADVRAGGAVLRPDRAAYPDLDIREGDEVIALERQGEPRWRVSSIDTRGHGRLIVNLGDST